MIKIVKTNINQTIEVKLPEGYVLDTLHKPILDTFSDELKIKVIKVEPVVKDNNE